MLIKIQFLTCDMLNLLEFVNQKTVRWVGHVGLRGKKRNACRILVKNPEGK
jgi:hypothetical protein